MALPTLAQLKASINGFASGIGDATNASNKQKAALAAQVVGMKQLNDTTMLLNRGVSTQIGMNQELIDTYVSLAAKSMVFEGRNKELNKTFGISSMGAAKLSETIHTLAKAHGFSGEQAIGYATSIKKLLPTMQQQGKANDKTYVSLQRIQHVLTTNLGLTEEATAKYTLYASKNGENADTTMAFASALAKQLGDTDGTMGYMKMAIEGIAAAGEDTQLQFGKIPGNLEIATIKAKQLGFELDDLADTGKHLLDIESSIGQELEYQLLSGHRLTDESGNSLTNAYREATLRGNMSDAASTLNTILEQEGEVLENNLFARKQMADLMGMDEASLSRALQKKKLLSSSAGLSVLMNLDGTELQKAADAMLKSGEMSQDAFDELSTLNDTRTTDDIMKQQLMVAHESLAVLSSMLTEDQKKNVEIQRDLLTSKSGIEGFKKEVMLDLNAKEMQGVGRTESISELIKLAEKNAPLLIPTKGPSYEAAETKTLGTPLVKGEDTVIPAGYGSRILTFPEDTLQADVAFKNDDTIIAGTSLSGNNSSGTTGAATDAGIMAMARMIVAAINSKGSNLFGATSMNDSTYQP
jgi:hypothetical protein